jgi:hypothetical protein
MKLMRIFGIDAKTHVLKDVQLVAQPKKRMRMTQTTVIIIIMTTPGPMMSMMTIALRSKE